MTHPYASAAYAQALAFLGRPIDVGEWSNFVVARPIPGGGADATGPYPRTPVDTNADIGGGLDRLRAEGLVSVVIVPDPLACPDPARFETAFDICRLFKTHLLIERATGFTPTRHHRDRIRRAFRRCRVEAVRLGERLAEWRSLYDALVSRHEIAGVANFPNSYFEALAAMDVFTAFEARVGGELAGMAIWFEHGGVAVSHLTAANSLGYTNGASYALYATAVEHFVDAAVFDLGGGAGHTDDPSDGLFRFKQGFSNAETKALLCGAVLDRPKYEALAAGRDDSFFPAYRS